MNDKRKTTSTSGKNIIEWGSFFCYDDFMVSAWRISAARVGTSWVYYALTFGGALFNGAIGPLLVLYLLSQRLTPVEIGILFSIRQITIMIFEYPTGLIADRFGRKRSLLVSYGLMAFLLPLWAVFVSFPHLILLSLLWGVAYTFQSGAKDAQMIRQLDLADNEPGRTSTFAHISQFGNLGAVVGGAIAIVLAVTALRWLWFGSALLYLALFLLALLFLDDAAGGSPDTKNRPRAALLPSALKNLHFVWRVQPIRYLIILSFVLSTVASAFTLIYPLIFKLQFHFPDYAFGALGIASALIGIAGIGMTKRAALRVGHHQLLRSLSYCLILALFLFGLSGITPLLLVAFFAIGMILHGWTPVYQSLLNRYLPESSRAGLLSLVSSVGLAGMALGGLVGGYLSSIMRPQLVLVLSGLFLLVGVILQRIFQKDRERENGAIV